MAARRRSPLEEDVSILGKYEPSGGDVCERCGCTRDEHDEDDGCACGRCERFLEFDST